MNDIYGIKTRKINGVEETEVMCDYSSKWIEKGIGAAVLIALIVLGYFGLAYAINKTEVMECYQWEMQAVQFKGNFYLTQWQKDQCDAHQIYVNAPVK